MMKVHVTDHLLFLKSVRISCFSPYLSVFSPNAYAVRLRENTEQKNLIRTLHAVGVVITTR